MRVKERRGRYSREREIEEKKRNGERERERERERGREREIVLWQKTPFVNSATLTNSQRLLPF